MPRKPSSIVPSQGLKAQARLALENINGTVKNAFHSASSKVLSQFHAYADKNLSPSHAAVYKQGVQTEFTVQPLEFQVKLEGKLPNALEHGWGTKTDPPGEPIDLKPGILSGRGSKMGKKGRYKDVLFKHDFNAQAPGIRAVLTKLQKEGKTQRIPKNRLHPKVHVAQGIRIGGELYTFRRVSENSPPESWMHPGFKGIKAGEALQKQVYEDVMDELSKVLGK